MNKHRWGGVCTKGAQRFLSELVRVGGVGIEEAAVGCQSHRCSLHLGLKLLPLEFVRVGNDEQTVKLDFSLLGVFVWMDRFDPIQSNESKLISVFKTWIRIVQTKFKSDPIQSNYNSVGSVFIIRFSKTEIF